MIIKEGIFTLKERKTNNGLAYWVNAIKSTDETIIIPSHINGIPIIGIQTKRSRFSVHIKKVIIEEGVRFIGRAAFLGTCIETIIIPSSIREIKCGAFRLCTRLKNIIFSEGLRFIRERAFEECDSIEELLLPDSVVTIEEGAFTACRRICSIKLPNKLRIVSRGCFAGIKNLKSIYVPDSVTDIEYNAFVNCSSLEDIKFGSGLKDIGPCAFRNIAARYSAIIPTSVNRIYSDSFSLNNDMDGLKFEHSNYNIYVSNKYIAKPTNIADLVSACIFSNRKIVDNISIKNILETRDPRHTCIITEDIMKQRSLSLLYLPQEYVWINDSCYDIHKMNIHEDQTIFYQGDRKKRDNEIKNVVYNCTLEKFKTLMKI